MFQLDTQRRGKLRPKKVLISFHSCHVSRHVAASRNSVRLSNSSPTCLSSSSLLTQHRTSANVHTGPSYKLQMAHYCKYIKKFNMSIDFRQWLFTLCLVFKQNEYVLSSRENPSLKTHEACVCSTKTRRVARRFPQLDTSAPKRHLKITNAKVPDQRTHRAVQEIKWI